MKRLFIAMLLMLTGIGASVAQENVSVDVSADLVNQYIWRGQDLGNVSLQPTLGVGYQGLVLTAWGSVGLSEPDDTKEFDLTLSYTTGGFSVGLTDYWFNTGLDPRGRYFKYDAHGTNHVWEAFAGYDFGVVALNAYTNIGGNDGTNADGKRAYSTYVELSAPFSLGGCAWTASVGAVPMATTSYGTTGFAVTNLSLRATKEIALTERFSLPVFAGLTANPCSQKAYLIVGLTLAP